MHRNKLSQIFREKACKCQMPRNLLSSNTGVSSICLAEIPHKIFTLAFCVIFVLTEASYPSQQFKDHESTFDIAYISFQDNYLPIRQQRYIVQPRVNAIIISLSNTHYHLSMLLCHKKCQQQDLRHLGLI